MEVSKGDVDRDEDDVGRVAEEVTPKLDGLAENEGPQGQSDEERLPVVRLPGLGCHVPGVEDKAVVGERPGGNCRLENRVGAPRLSTAMLVNDRLQS